LEKAKIKEKDNGNEDKKHKSDNKKPKAMQIGNKA